MTTRRRTVRIAILPTTPALAALVLLPVLCSCASAPADEGPDRKLERSVERAAEALAQKPDADALAAAGIFRLHKNGKSALALLARATAAAPERPDLTWLQARACEAVPLCDPAPVEARLRKLDPDNGAGWMGELGRAGLSRDESAERSALIAIGRSGRVDIYWTMLVARLSEAAARTEKISLPSAIDVIAGQLSGFAIPPYAAVSGACKDDRLTHAEVVETCRAVAAALRHGDTYITEMMGATIAKRVWPGDSQEWREADQVKRVYDHHYKITSRPEYEIEDDAAAERYIVLLAQHRREQDAVRARIVARGENPEPPDVIGE
jgi:hypothetical protein